MLPCLACNCNFFATRQEILAIRLWEEYPGQLKTLDCDLRSSCCVILETMAKGKKLIQKTGAVVAHSEYAKWIASLKNKIRSAQLKAAISVNREMIKLYWEIGQDIAHKQEREAWGTKIVERVAKDLQNEFPGIEGFSRTNIFRMRAFYLAYAIVPQAVGQLENLPVFNIPWGHNAVLLEKLKNREERLWYANMTITEGWSREALIDSIKSKMHKRYGKAITNFHERLPALQSRLAHETLKDPYNFDFLELAKDHIERDVEDGLLNHIEKFIGELGQGFSFVGRQVHLEVGGKDFYLDLVFYHLKLRCFVLIELKATDFKPEFAGKLNFYLSAVDDLMKHPSDNPTIGILICKRKNNFIAEYALRDINKPMGVAEYETKIMKSLPKNLQGQLPTVEEIEAELSTGETMLVSPPLKAAKRPKKKPRSR
jgi:predicted nuclease of restriction endonuclease-like (RecB) superfamily